MQRASFNPVSLHTRLLSGCISVPLGLRCLGDFREGIHDPSLEERLLQLARLVHGENNVAAADELAVEVELGDRGPGAGEGRSQRGG